MKTISKNKVILSLALLSAVVLPSFAKDALPQSYLDGCGERIKKAWFPPAGSEKSKGVVTYTLRRDGTVSGVRVTESLHNADADKSMVLAVKNTVPFPKTNLSRPCAMRVIFDVTHNAPGQPCKVELVKVE
jgi:TonB family protein